MVIIMASNTTELEMLRLKNLSKNYRSKLFNLKIKRWIKFDRKAIYKSNYRKKKKKIFIKNKKR